VRQLRSQPPAQNADDDGAIGRARYLRLKGAVGLIKLGFPADRFEPRHAANSPLSRLATFSTRRRSTITSPGEDTNSLNVCMESPTEGAVENGRRPRAIITFGTHNATVRFHATGLFGHGPGQSLVPAAHDENFDLMPRGNAGRATSESGQSRHFSRSGRTSAWRPIGFSISERSW